MIVPEYLNGRNNYSQTFAKKKKSKLNLNRVQTVYLLGSDEGSRDGLRLVPAEDPGEAKVGNLGVHVGVEQDVAGLEITVDNLELRVLVEVLKASSDAVDDPVPLLPAQLLMSTEENEVEAPVGDELVDEQPLLLLQADTDQPDQVLVLQLGHQRQLVLELIHFTAISSPSGRTPLYTAPTPPSPSLLLSSKSPVAVRRVETSIIIESTTSLSPVSAAYLGSVQVRIDGQYQFCSGHLNKK
jgi:hypothetical protein